jgi:hypothetical protein
MNRYIPSAIFTIILLLTAGSLSAAVPEPFQEFDASSKYVIKYDDLTAMLKTVVVDVGRSTREVAAPTQAKTGTRMKAKVKRSTIKEGNRFYYENFEGNEEAKQFLTSIRESLVALPDEAPLKYFSRDEQLAYWLNLYNVTLLNEIVAIYPKRDLKKVITGKKSILAKKLITVAGVPLSLNDIQYTILKENYNNNPMIIYGLYQGIIGGPNIRRRAFTGSDVHRALENNALEFINSNRGTYSYDPRTFKVSSLYDRNEVFFPDFEADLTRHLLAYLEGPEHSALQSASRLKADINDWTVTDLGGTFQEIGGSLADNNAALLDSIKSTAPTGQGDPTAGGGMPGAIGYGGHAITSKAKPYNRIDPELLEVLIDLNEKREATNALNATVTVEELGEVPVEKKPEPDKDK